LREALELGHNYIGTEHILLGLIREGEGVAARVLVDIGADLNRVRQRVVQLLTGYADTPPVAGLARAEVGSARSRARHDRDERRDALGALLSFLDTLDARAIPHELGRTHPGSITVRVAIPGWRWEIEFLADGSVEVVRFHSVAGVETDPALLDRLIADAM
jgi:hypothetical protein